MTKTITALTAFMLTAIMLLITAVLLPSPASAQQAESNGNPAQTTQATNPAPSSPYRYTAQSGDSYTKFARKAVQSYGKINNVNLTQGQIIFVETTLTQAAGSPQLNLGEERTFDEAKLKEAVDNANKLTDAQKAAWAAYASNVNFNTDKVGQK